MEPMTFFAAGLLLYIVIRCYRKGYHIINFSESIRDLRDDLIPDIICSIRSRIEKIRPHFKIKGAEKKGKKRFRKELTRKVEVSLRY